MGELTREQQDDALMVIARWLGPQMGYQGAALTGPKAARSAMGPQLIRDWDWPSSGPTPTVILEGGPEEWAIHASGDAGVVKEMTALGIFCEPYAGYALCLYPLGGE